MTCVAPGGDDPQHIRIVGQMIRRSCITSDLHERYRPIVIRRLVMRAEVVRRVDDVHLI